MDTTVTSKQSINSYMDFLKHYTTDDKYLETLLQIVQGFTKEMNNSSLEKRVKATTKRRKLAKSSNRKLGKENKIR